MNQKNIAALILLTLVLTAPLALSAQKWKTEDYRIRMRLITFSEFGNSGIIKDEPNSFFYLAIAGIVVEPKYNLLTFSDKSSVSLAAPVQLIGGYDITKEGFIIGPSIGLIPESNFGYESSHNNISANGGSIGAGLYANMKIISGESNQFYWSPVLRFGIFRTVNILKGSRSSTYIELGIPNFLEEGPIQSKPNAFLRVSYFIKV